MIPHWILKAALSLAFLAIAIPSAMAQPAPATRDTIPREEYEQLRQDFQQMHQRLQTLEAQQATQLEVARDARNRSGEVAFDLTNTAAPNWERGEGWMGPEFRTTQMDLLIGRAQNIDLYLGLQTAGRVQWLEQRDVFVAGEKASNLDPGFQTAWGDLAFLADVDDGKMLVFFDLYISSRPHPSTMYGNEGYIIIRQLPGESEVSDWLNRTLFKMVNVKVGHFEIDYGDFHYRRSDNAWVQRNHLIGNTIIDPDVEEIGMEIYSKPQWLNWLVGISSGTTTENLNEGRGIASIHGKLWRDWNDEFRTSVSGYFVDHSDNPAGGAGGTKGSLFSGRRSGGPYGAIFGGGNAPGQVLPGKDQLVTAFQGDVTWAPRPWEFYGNIGWMQDADPNGNAPGSPEESWTYGMAEVAYYFTPRLYGAGRYSLAMANDIAGQSSDGLVHRIQLGGGYWVTRNMLAKLEAVYQRYQGFGASDGSVGGVDAFTDPEAFGLIAEVSFAF